MAQTLSLESTVIQQETGKTADILFIPAATLERAELGPPDEATEVLGLPLGVSVHTTEDIQDLLFASLAGRVYPFDEGSFNRWRPLRLGRPDSPEATFARQLATEDLVAVSSSPIHGVSITTLVTQGTAWAVSGADMLFHDPWQGLGLSRDLRDRHDGRRCLPGSAGDAGDRGEVPPAPTPRGPSRLDPARGSGQTLMGIGFPSFLDCHPGE